MDEKAEMITRIKHLIEKDSQSKSRILRELQLSTSTLSDWERGKGNPSSSAIIKLANYFDVSTDYILFGREEKTLSPVENEWVNIYHSLSVQEREICTAFLRGILAEKNLKER